MRFLACSCALLLGTPLLGMAALGEEPPLLREARMAVGESVPEVAIFKLRQLLAVQQLGAPERAAGRLLLGEALARAGKLEEALSALQPLVKQGDSAALLLRAQVLGRLGRWADALPLFRAQAGLPDAPEAVLLGEAEALQALNQPAEAIVALEKLRQAKKGGARVPLRLAVLLVEQKQRKRAQEILRELTPQTPEDTKWRDYVEARLLLLDEQAAPALNRLEAILQEREHLPEALLAAATFAATEARVALYGTEAADSQLETFIWRYPASSWLEAAFRRLDQLYAREENPPEVELRKWTQKAPAHRAALARFYLGKMQARLQKWEKAASSLEAFVTTYPQHPLISEAELMRADVFAATGQLASAVQSLEAAMRGAHDAETRADIEFRTGLVNYQQGEFLLSATMFEAAARRSSRVRAVATFDAALAWLHQRNFTRFADSYRAFIQLQPNSPLRSDLLLEEALVLARTGDETAPERLQAFLHDFPRDPRQGEARLALAELYYLDDSGAEALAGIEILRTATEPPPAPQIVSAADYLAIFQADAQAPRDDERVIALALKFLEAHPQAPQRAEVRLKLGQVYFRREDYANAETQFATLATESPGSPYVEPALYLAGESAVNLMNPGAVDRALQFFDRVVKLDGPFKLYARQQQALVQSRLGNEDQAIALYDLILAAHLPAEAELRHAALCGKGDNLLALGRRQLPKTENIEAALAVYQQLAATPNVPALWRNQALYKAGKAYEQAGRTEEALASFYDVLNRTTAEEREFFWFFKAGFDAAQHFEQQEQWASAAGIYRKMAKLQGPRTAEAQARLRQLRLEHFLWE